MKNTQGTPAALKFTKPQLLEIYQKMCEMRRFEERAASLYQQGQIGGFCHLYIGQEAILAGCKAATKEGDDYITSYRCHATALACGVPPQAVMDELCGKATGISKGKGGSMHMFDPAKNFWGGHGIVAAQAPLGAGLAFRHKYNGTDGVALTFLGDGAANAGQFFESLNMAAVWKLPVLFIIENNRYGMGTSVPRAAAGDLYKRGEPFGIKGQQIDGQDFFTVANAVNQAVTEIRSTGMPQLIEFDTYRYRGHSMSDPGNYRHRTEVEEIKRTRDPLLKLAEQLTQNHGINQADLDQIDDQIKTEIKTVADQALQAPLPDESQLWTEIHG